MTKEELLAAQKALEQESLDLGVMSYRKMRERGEADLLPGQKLIKEAVGPLAEAIGTYLTECEAGVPSRAAGVYYFLSQWQQTPEIPAYVTARYVVDCLATSTIPLQSLATRIATCLEDQVNHEALREENPRAYRQLLKKIKKSSSPGYRHVVLRKQQKYAGVTTTKWGRNERVRLGVLLVELMQQTSGLFDITAVSVGKNDTPNRVVPNEATLQWLDNSHARCELLTPTNLPMVIKPCDWSDPFNGGYLSKKLRRPLVKGVHTNVLKELRDHEMPMVYRALNAMQDTAWAINSAIYRLMTEAWDGGSTLGGLPGRNPLPLPAKTFGAEATSDDPRVKDWRARAAEVYEKNLSLRSKRIQMQCKLWVAEKMSNFERFHFVHALDFRGRAYAVASFLNPQADDSAKALLQFADGKPLGTNGAFWLAVHGANTFGVDKVSFDDRTRWVSDHEAQIMECANNPLDGSRWWTQADSPWQFLAFCIEWRNLNVWSVALGNTPETFTSFLAVGMDGACNGLQNFSAMLRDEVGGSATNLVPHEKPSDIYAQVAAEASLIIDADAAAGDEVAKRWVGKITRKLTKRNTMTVPYAVTEFGMRGQLVSEFKKLREEDDCDPVIDAATLEDATYLARVNYAAIGKVVIAARAAMDWLKDTARAVAADELPVQWQTPSGFIVVQDYREWIGDELDFTVCGRRFRLTMTRMGDKLNRRRQASGISPNFIHALDAAHLQRTVGLCADAGVTHFAMIHDSYGTHAADVQTMAHLLRQAFVEQYSGDVLGDFREQMIKQVPEELAKKIPPTPPMGKLELTAVMDSDYFFA